MAIVINGTGSISGLSNVGGIASAQSGSVLQVVNATYNTQTSTTSTTYVDTGLTASITPQFSTSKILVLASVNGLSKGTVDVYMQIQLVRNSTALTRIVGSALYTGSTTQQSQPSAFMSYLDSPATTSSTTYKAQFLSSGGQIVFVQDTSSVSNITLMEIAA